MPPMNNELDSGKAAKHDEWLMDEAIRGSFPASDPASSSAPGSIVNLRYAEAAADQRGSNIAGVAASLLLVALASPGGNALAQDKAAYEQRAIARFEQQFAALDRAGKGEVTRTDAEGYIDFTAAFDDIDINRDGIVTKSELHRYLVLRYGAAPNP